MPSPSPHEEAKLQQAIRAFNESQDNEHPPSIRSLASEYDVSYRLLLRRTRQAGSGSGRRPVNQRVSYKQYTVLSSYLKSLEDMDVPLSVSVAHEAAEMVVRHLHTDSSTPPPRLSTSLVQRVLDMHLRRKDPLDDHIERLAAWEQEQEEEEEEFIKSEDSPPPGSVWATGGVVTVKDATHSLDPRKQKDFDDYYPNFPPEHVTRLWDT